jgi:hypothetical protein
MRRFFTYLVLALFVLSAGGSLQAVEKKKTPKSKADQQENKNSPQPNDSSKLKPQQPGKKYDNFVDDNRNGIDDRRENLKKKSPAKDSSGKDSSSTKDKK